MASSINGADIKVVGSPDIYYNITYTASRPSNSKAKYDFTIKTKIGDSSSSWLGKGYVLTLYITVGGVQQSVVLKEYDESWTTKGVVMSTKTVSVTCPSTTANTKQTVTFQVVNKSSAFDGSSGEIKTTDYYVTSPALLYSACTKPTTFTASSNNFESSVTLSWSGASAGTNNSITGYLIHYRTSSNNSTWGDWIRLEDNAISSTSTSGSYTKNMSSLVSRGYYVQFRIRTLGSAGSDYYSDYKESSSIRRNPYTSCTSPTTFTVSANDFDTSVTITWSDATAGTNNAINGYLIRYNVSTAYNSTSAWVGWKDLKTIATTKTSGSVTIDLSSLVQRGYYVQFAIKTQGTAGSSYDSSYIYANSTTSANATKFRRNPYTQCTPPTNVTITSEADINGTKHNDIFNSSITIAWSAGGAGENNAIQRYYIQYCTSSDDSIWGDWMALQSSDLTPVGTSTTTVNVASIINRGAYMKIRIRTEGVVVTSDYAYHSTYVESASIRRNSVPNSPTTFTIGSHPTLEFSKGEAIKLQWDKPVDINDNIFRYRIQYAIGSKNNVSNNTINNTWSNLATIDNKNTLEWTISETNSLFNQMENYQSDSSNSLIQFRIQVVDVFQEYNNGNSSYYTYSPIVTRYDMTGIAIGIDGKWVNCQLFVGTNGSWVEQIVSAGINNKWVNADDGT